jgi:hypothetical protein
MIVPIKGGVETRYAVPLLDRELCTKKRRKRRDSFELSRRNVSANLAD